MQKCLQNISTLVFDLDNTLYPAHCKLFDQIDAKMTAFVANLLSLEQAEARALQKRYFYDYGTTLAGLMEHHAVKPHDFLDYVHDIDLSPLPESSHLAAALAACPRRKLVFTNGSTRHAENILAHLGLLHFFDGIFDIHAAEYDPKPSLKTYEKFVARFGVPTDKAIMFDDIPRNLEPAKQLGMATVLVEGDDDEYNKLTSLHGTPNEAYIDITIRNLPQWLHDNVHEEAA